MELCLCLHLGFLSLYVSHTHLELMILYHLSGVAEPASAPAVPCQTKRGAGQHSTLVTRPHTRLVWIAMWFINPLTASDIILHQIMLTWVVYVYLRHCRILSTISFSPWVLAATTAEGISMILLTNGVALENGTTEPTVCGGCYFDDNIYSSIVMFLLSSYQSSEIFPQKVEQKTS